ncbi:MAG: U32 family peptidase [Muribaculaceae bacterium]|nr:U32 family peptidase [Muribaculaceae bacterium]
MVRQLELLAPAGNSDIAIEAILHGADAVYMGASSHGARRSAANSLDEVRRVVDFAHIFRARVYVTVNTIVYEKEIKQVEQLISDLYRIGVDAIIVQDMGILRMDIPPIELHASTQCDIRTPRKARFLQDAGFSQLVLPRELTLEEIRKMSEAVNIPLEVFVHGALCVSYSGRCHASFATCGRSANRGECAQLCRLPYTLTDSKGKVISRDKHLLSLRDLNTIDLLPRLIEAGVSSFKIEGRLKEASYVKNTVSAYRRAIDDFIKTNPERYRRSSFGVSEVSFTPNLSKSFNRGFSHYFIERRRPLGIISPDTPKSLGEVIEDVSKLNNGDGISFFDLRGNYTGAMVNGVQGRRIITARPVDIPKGADIHRTFDRVWDKELQRPTAMRKIGVSFLLDDNGLSASDERGCSVRIPLECKREKANKPQDYYPIFAKLGNTSYRLIDFKSEIDPSVFIPAGQLTELRRRAIAALDEANRATYDYHYRKTENLDALYFSASLDYRDNVANSLAERFYREHGVEKIERALETSRLAKGKKLRLMTTRHCILRELGMCKKEKGLGRYSEPLVLQSGKDRFDLEFNCKDCEMHVMSESR